MTASQETPNNTVGQLRQEARHSRPRQPEDVNVTHTLLFDPVRIVADLVKIPSVIYAELEAAQYVADFLRELDFEVSIDDLSNVLAWRDFNTGGPSLLFCGHHDTVPVGSLDNWSMDPLGAEVLDGQLFGRGAVDDKGGVGSALAAVGNAIAEGHELAGRIVFASVREETSDPRNRGAIRLVENGLRADLAVVTEPTSLDICLGHRGRVELEIVTKGRTAHSSTPHLGVNAIEHMALVVEALRQLPLPSVPPLGSGSQNVGTIIGGTQSNVVPDECLIRVDRRIVAGETGDTVAAEVRKALEPLQADHTNLLVEVKVINTYLPSFMSANDSWVQEAARIVESVRKEAPKLYYMNAHTDQEWLVNNANIPTIILAPGDMDRAHTPDESIATSEIAAAEQIFRRLILSTLRTGTEKHDA